MSTDKKTLTLNLTESEMRSLEELAIKKGLTKTQILKNAIRSYQALDKRISEGHRIFFESDKKDYRAELCLL